MGDRVAEKGIYTMNWSSVSDFFAMGGYGLYVWGSYVVTFICIVGEIWFISNRRRTLEKQYSLIRNINIRRDKK